MQLLGSEELEALKVPTEVRAELMNNTNVGFKVGLYRDYVDNRFILSFAGSDDFPDIFEDVWQGLGWDSVQYPPAMMIADALNRNERVKSA